MIENFRFELSFKNISQLDNQLNFFLLNNIKKINIPCKGSLKKEFLNKVVDYIGKNYPELEVVYHYSLYHQYSKNKENSYLEFLNFINKCNSFKVKEILLVSGSNKKINFDVLDVANNLRNEKNLKINLGFAYNPYLKKYYSQSSERIRFERKISSGLTKSIWLQFGTDINLLENEIIFLKKSLSKNLFNNGDNNFKLFGSLLIPSKQFLARFKFRPWKDVYISDEFLHSLDNFYSFTKDLISFYLDNSICPVVETECSSIKKLEDIYNLINI